MWGLLIWVVVLMYASLWITSNYLSTEEIDSRTNSRYDRFDTVHLCSDLHVDITKPPTAIDGIQTKTNWRILLNGQDDKTKNGIYTTSTYEWARSLDTNKHTDFENGKSVFILYGKHYGQTLHTARLLSDVPPDKNNFNAVVFEPIILSMTKKYQEGYQLRKDGIWERRVKDS